MDYKRENEFVEFKESLGQLNRGLESLTAMLNKHGRGVVLFGIKDDGDVIGVNIGNKTLKDISDAITSRIKPVVIPTITEEENESKIVIRVEVSGYNKPYSADGKYLIRSGNENKKIEPEIMRQLLFSNSSENSVKNKSFFEDINLDVFSLSWNDFFLLLKLF